MSTFKYLLLSLFLLAGVAAHSQYQGQDTETDAPKKTKAKSKKETSVRQKNKKAAIAAIRQLKNGGAVLYMVRDSKTSSAMLRQKGYDELAKKREEEAHKKQLFIARSLAKKFTFCPVYFFYQSDIEKIQKGEFTGNLLDSNLVRQPSITFSHPYFLILDYGDLYNEPGKVYSDTAAADISGKMPIRENCFVFKNRFLSQLNDPFPNAVRCDYPYKDLYEKIRKINKRLARFYTKHAEG